MGEVWKKLETQYMSKSLTKKIVFEAKTVRAEKWGRVQIFNTT